MPYPVAHGLLGATVIAASPADDSFRQNWKYLLIGAILAIFPDFDLLLAWGLRLGDDWHRSFSHSILFSIATGFLTAILAGQSRAKVAIIYIFAALTHPLLDLLPASDLGVELFWPFSTHRYQFGLFEYPTFPLNPHPKYFHWADTLAGLFRVSLRELALFAPLLLCVLLIKRRSVRRRSEKTLQDRLQEHEI